MSAGKFDPYMRPKVNRPIPSTSSQIIGLISALVGLAFGIGGGIAFVDGLITGRTYSVALIFGDSAKVSERSDPSAYWTAMGLLCLCCVGGIIVGIGVLREVVVDHKRKIEERKSRTETAIQEKDNLTE
jgi:hypothetical protein